MPSPPATHGAGQRTTATRRVRIWNPWEEFYGGVVVEEDAGDDNGRTRTRITTTTVSDGAELDRNGRWRPLRSGLAAIGTRSRDTRGLFHPLDLDRELEEEEDDDDDDESESESESEGDGDGVGGGVGGWRV